MYKSIITQPQHAAPLPSTDVKAPIEILVSGPTARPNKASLLSSCTQDSAGEPLTSEREQLNLGVVVSLPRAANAYHGDGSLVNASHQVLCHDLFQNHIYDCHVNSNLLSPTLDSYKPNRAVMNTDTSYGSVNGRLGSYGQQFGKEGETTETNSGRGARSEYLGYAEKSATPSPNSPTTTTTTTTGQSRLPMDSADALRTSISSRSSVVIASPRPGFQSHSGDVERLEKSIEDLEYHSHPVREDAFPYPPSALPLQSQDQPPIYPPSYQHDPASQYLTGQTLNMDATGSFDMYNNPSQQPLAGYDHAAHEATPPSAIRNMARTKSTETSTSHLWRDFNGVHIRGSLSIGTSYSNSTYDRSTVVNTPPAQAVPHHRLHHEPSAKDMRHTAINHPSTQTTLDPPSHSRDKWRCRMTSLLPAFFSNGHPPSPPATSHPTPGTGTGEARKTRNALFSSKFPYVHSNASFRAAKRASSHDVLRRVPGASTAAHHPAASVPDNIAEHGMDDGASRRTRVRTRLHRSIGRSFFCGQHAGVVQEGAPVDVRVAGREAVDALANGRHVHPTDAPAGVKGQKQVQELIKQDVHGNATQIEQGNDVTGQKPAFPESTTTTTNTEEGRCGDALAQPNARLTSAKEGSDQETQPESHHTNTTEAQESSGDAAKSSDPNPNPRPPIPPDTRKRSRLPIPSRYHGTSTQTPRGLPTCLPQRDPSACATQTKEQGRLPVTTTTSQRIGDGPPQAATRTSPASKAASPLYPDWALSPAGSSSSSAKLPYRNHYFAIQNQRLHQTGPRPLAQSRTNTIMNRPCW